LGEGAGGEGKGFRSKNEVYIKIWDNFPFSGGFRGNCWDLSIENNWQNRIYVIFKIPTGKDKEE
jgi:hypothetical protein